MQKHKNVSYAFVSPPYQPMRLRDVFTLSAVGKFYVHSTNGTNGTGSGCNICLYYNNTAYRFFLTARHNIVNPSINRYNGFFNINESYVKFELGVDSQKAYRINKILLPDYDIDLALLLLESSVTQENCIRLSRQNISLGQELWVPHYPQGGSMKISHGVATTMDFGDPDGNFAYLDRLSMYEESDCFRYTCPTERGSSGSPVILKDSNEVIGVHVRGDQNTQDFHTALKVNYGMIENTFLTELRVLFAAPTYSLSQPRP